MMMNNKILNYLDELFPNAKCELEYNKDYEFLIAVMLSAQTTDKKVNQVTKILFDKYKSLEELNNAELLDIKNIIKPIGTYNRKAIYVKSISDYLIKNYNGVVPNNIDELEKIDGVGHKTAQVVLGVLFNEPTFAVDTHVSRISKRLGLANMDDDVKKIEIKLKKLIDKKRWTKTHHQMVLFGRYYCKSINPSCANCKLKDICKGK